MEEFEDPIEELLWMCRNARYDTFCNHPLVLMSMMIGTIAKAGYDTEVCAELLRQIRGHRKTPAFAAKDAQVRLDILMTNKMISY